MTKIIIQIMTNIGIVVLLILFMALAAGSVYLNLFCNNEKDQHEL